MKTILIESNTQLYCAHFQYDKEKIIPETVQAFGHICYQIVKFRPLMQRFRS